MEHSGIGWVRRKIGVEEPQVAEVAAEPEQREEPLGVSRTFVDQGAEFQGRLYLREAFRIDGEFRGEIVSETTVIVGPAAGIEASIRAKEVIIAGAVVGDIRASRQLVLKKGARLTGDVEAPCLEIARGAVFNGRTTMMRPEVMARAEAKALRAKDRPRSRAQAQIVDRSPALLNSSAKRL
jgi:cytoskeletal protein CcmA (bactofilin family)